MDLAFTSALPVVCTTVTGEVERIVGKNGLHFHELLSAFSSCQLKTHFRSVSSHFPLNELKVRFVRSADLRPRHGPVTDDLLRSAMLPLPDETDLLSKREVTLMSLSYPRLTRRRRVAQPLNKQYMDLVRWTRRRHRGRGGSGRCCRSRCSASRSRPRRAPR